MNIDWAKLKTAAAIEAEASATWRETATCTRMQGILALGEARWAQVMAYYDDPATTWGERMVIDSAADWRRNSENIAFFAYLLDLSPTEVDDLFVTAQGIEA